MTRRTGRLSAALAAAALFAAALAGSAIATPGHKSPPPSHSTNSHGAMKRSSPKRPPADQRAAPRARAAAATFYHVMIHTGLQTGAGTDSPVWINLKGTAGESGFVQLDNGTNTFERGQVDHFGYYLPNLGVGRLKGATVWYGGPYDPWNLDRVVVNDTSQPWLGLQIMPANRWMAVGGNDLTVA